MAMLTDSQFALTQQPASICTYYGFGFVPCPIHTAVGMVEHTRLGATHYYIQIGTVHEPRWIQVESHEYHQHCKTPNLIS